MSKNSKSTGIVRRMDSLGRVVIPMEIRKVLDISTNDAIEIELINSSVVLKKYNENRCMFCSSDKDTMIFKDKNICRDCIHELKI
jgi:transcriptional pleiotropic regulator of transition state genes